MKLFVENIYYWKSFDFITPFKDKDIRYLGHIKGQILWKVIKSVGQWLGAEYIHVLFCSLDLIQTNILSLNLFSIHLDSKFKRKQSFIFFAFLLLLNQRFPISIRLEFWRHLYSWVLRIKVKSLLLFLLLFCGRH